MPASLGDVTQSTFSKEVEAHKLHEEFEVEGLIHTLTFDAALVTGNLFDMNIAGNAITQVPFNADSDTTMGDIATVIAAITGIKSAEVVVITGAGNDRVIKITPDDQLLGIAIDTPVVTGGASQAGVVAATVNNKIFKGMPVEQDPDNGKVIPFANDGNLEYIGVALHNAGGGELATIGMRGYAVIFAHASEALSYGPVNWDSYDEANGINKYNQTAVTTTTFQGWSLDSAAADGDPIRVVVRN